MRVLLFAASVVLCNGCMTPRSVIEIPECADRVEMTGQADRQGNHRFELDHTFDLMLTRTQLSFQADGKVQTFVVESNQPDPLRLFFGIGAVVGGALLVGNASYEVTERGVDPYSAVPFWSTIGGGSLIALGIGAAVTGWHPGQSYVTFPDACAR